MNWQNIIKRRKTQRLEEESYITDRIRQGKEKVLEDKNKVKFVGDSVREQKERDIKRYGKEFLRRQKKERQRLKNMDSKQRLENPVVDLKGD